MKESGQVKYLFILGLFLCLFIKCGSNEKSILGPVPFPEDNKYDKGIAELGKVLFFDKRLSLDNTVACATCHNPELAFTDGKKISHGVNGRKALRNAPSLLNVAFQHTLMADGQVPTIEMQALVPLLDTSEMANEIAKLLEKLNKIDNYRESALTLFNRNFDAFVLTRSLAAFQRTLLSDNSPFDRYYYKKEENAISSKAKFGWKIFSKELYCTKCHAAPFFTSFKVDNNGLYADYSPMVDKGRYRINGDSTKIGSFKIPSLRNITVTAPYMHDGSFENLDQVLTFYSNGGNKNPYQNKVIKPFYLTVEKRAALKAFFECLKDENP